MSAFEQDSEFSDFSRLYLLNMNARTAAHPGFHMPGHAGARFFTKEYADALIRTDTTELSSTDDLHEPSGPALAAMREASRIYGSKETIFITTGSTTGIHVMLASIIRPDTFLLIPRTVHMSVLHAITLLDCRYAFIPFPETAGPSGYLYPQLTPEMLENAFSLYPQATDILLVSPDYYGQSADLSELAKSAHLHGCRLLVDEAHGSHFTFSKNLFPQDAVSSNADMCVQSLHKTLPAMTMASQIHISGEAVNKERIIVSRVWEMLRLFETSSPSFVIAASAEYALAWMEKNGAQALSQRIQDINDFLGKISPLIGDQTETSGEAGFRDPLHMILRVDPETAFAPDLLKDLEARGIYAEFADLLRLVFIISPWQNKKDFNELFDAVSESIVHSKAMRKAFTSEAGMAPADEEARITCETDRLWGNLLTCIPQRGMELRTAVFGGREKKTVDILSAEGKICTSVIAPYPPGIALLWPGEIISKEHIILLKRLEKLKITVHGTEKGKIEIFAE